MLVVHSAARHASICRKLIGPLLQRSSSLPRTAGLR